MRVDGLAGLSEQQIATLRNGLRLMALRAFGDADTAEDVVQETLLRALNAVTPEIAADSTRLGAFAGGIARHVIADVRRRESRIVALDPEATYAPNSDSLEHVLRAEQRALVTQHLARLSPADQTVLRAAFFEGLTPTQIAQRMSESPEVVRKRKSRALARLRAALENGGHVDRPAPSIV